jgi:peptidyl-prolyl isomerase E (cyclophilin E)
MYNMHDGELFGRVLRCNYAQAPRGGSAGGTRPAWEDADAYAAAAAAREEEEEEEEDEEEGGKGDAMAGLEANVD